VTFSCLFLLIALIAPGGAHATTQSGSLTSGQWAYYDIVLPTPQSGVRLVLSSSASSDFYLYTGIDHTAGTQVAASYGQTLHTLSVPAASLTDGASYHVRIRANAALTYAYTPDLIYVRDLAWDPGASLTGTNIMNQPDAAGGDYLFRVSTRTPLHPGWRTMLRVTGGEADVYLQQDTPPLGSGTYSSTQAGSDAIYLNANQFSAGQTWYIRVHAATGATWQLLSGDLYVQDLTWDSGSQLGGTSPLGQPDTAAGEYFFRITTQAGAHGAWRTVLRVSGGNADLYLQQGGVPINGWQFGSTQPGSDVIYIDAGQFAAGQTWYVRVHAAAGATWQLFSGDLYVQDLTWDSGSQPGGTSLLSQPDTAEGEYFFRVTSQTSSYGAWRTVLKVTGGEADLYLQQGSAPLGNGQYSSTRVGSDGIILTAAGQFVANQVWYVRVHAAPASTWQVFSGDVYVQDLGTVADAATSSGTVQVGPEGTCYFRSNVDAATRGWRLWLNGANLPIYVKQGAAPVKSPWTEVAEQTETGQMLLVPPYLINAVYLIGVNATPGTTFTLDSRKQQTLVPNTLAGYTGSGAANFAFTLTGQGNGGGFGYITYRIDVPVQQIAWQVNVTPGAANQNPDVYIRQGAIPNRWMNGGFSEAPAGVVDSITQVPPTLIDGAWYVTVYGAGSFTFTLQSGNPAVTPATYINAVNPALPPGYSYPYNTVPITNDDTNRSGWRFYQVSDIGSQLGFLGWQLDLANQVGGTEIALRRNAVPARWNYRNGGSAYNTTVSQSYNLDVSSTIGFLQHPNHQADIWYVGVYTPDQALGPFQLTTREIPAPPITINDGSSQCLNNPATCSNTMTVTSQPAGTWKWFKVTVPADASLAGWDLRLRASGGHPRMVVRRDQLPGDFGTSWPVVFTTNAWASGAQWGAGGDWTGRYNGDPDSYLVMGLGSPLVAGTYYVGVSRSAGDPDPTPLSYTLVSRGIGMGNDAHGVAWPLQVRDLAFSGSGNSVSGTNLAPREAAYYRVTVPAGAKSWAVQMTPTAGEALLTVRQGALPNVQAGYRGYYDRTPVSDDQQYFQGVKRQKGGQEFFYKYAPDSGAAITAGAYYLAVVSEGQNPPDATSIGSGGVNYTVTSVGEVAVADKTATPLAVGAPVAWSGETLAYGEQKVYRFRVPAGLTSMEIRLKNRVGNPVMSVRRDPAGSGKIPATDPSSNPDVSGNVYGDTGAGYRYQSDETGAGYLKSDPTLITIPQPAEGDYTLTVAANALYANNVQIYPDAACDVEVTGRTPTTVPFTSGSSTVTGQDPQSWQYFEVTVPTDANLLGWDLRLQVNGGNPRMVVRRDQLPGDFSTTYPGSAYFFTHSTWDSGYQWAAGGDWTGRYSGDPNSYLVMGIGSPLVAGTYYVGVSRGTYDTSTTPLSYTLVSRGIGIGNDSNGVPWPIQVRDLAFSGSGNSVSGTNLAPREAAYYRVTVPAGAKSWAVQMTPTTGEALLTVRQGALPNVEAGYREYYQGTPVSDDQRYFQGLKRQKGGREFFYKYAPDSGAAITAGVYYLAVVSEGQNPPDATTIGSGGVNYTLTSEGEMPVADKTATPLAVGAPVTWNGETLSYGQEKVYRFRVPAGLTSMEIRLKNRVGNPVMSVRRDPAGSGKIPASDPSYNPGISGNVYGNAGYSYNYQSDETGAAYLKSDPTLITIPQPAEGDYTLTVSADALYANNVQIYPDAACDVEVTALVTQPLAVTGAALQSGTLVDKQVAYYVVTIPAAYHAYPVVGWKMNVGTTNGKATIRVRKDSVPTDDYTGTVSSDRPMTTIVPPFLTPGTWYVEVKGTGLTDYAFTSDIITAEPPATAGQFPPYHRRSWGMPAKNGTFTQAGLQSPSFGDSGIDDSGTNIVNPSTGDLGIDLAAGEFHYYRVVVPDNNGAHLRTTVEALSGTPALYIRKDYPPTIDHKNSTDPNNYYAPYPYDRIQSVPGTMYGNWVPLDGRIDSQLPPGDWWIAVRAVGSNIRYRLKLSAGNVRGPNGPVPPAGIFQDLTLGGGNVAGQTLAAGDMRYYRLNVPQSSTTTAASTPLAWTINLQRTVGDVAVFVRDTSPPGQGSDGNAGGNATTGSSYFQDWYDDNSQLNPNPYVVINTAGDTTLAVPPLKPGKTYYLGVYARTDSTFNLASSIGVETLVVNDVIPFVNGTLTTSLAAGESRLYRIDAPADAVYWHQTAQHDVGINLSLYQDTIPPPDYTQAHWSSNYCGPSNCGWQADSSFGTAMSAYPRQAGHSYYLLVKNTTAGSLPFTFSMDGRTTMSPLNVTVTGNGAGTITSSPNVITCGSGTCSAQIVPLTQVTLYANPASGSSFAGWTGACTGQGSTCTLQDGTGAAAAVATFTLNSYAVSVYTSGSGSGTVTSNPAGISCPGGSCSANFSYGTSVTLTATPLAGSTFTGWSGACSGTGVCTVTVDGPKYVTVNFATATLAVTINSVNGGGGSVNSVPAGIACTTGTCSAGFSVGTPVTLVPTADANSFFSGWSGACTNPSGNCTMTMDADKSVAATFGYVQPVMVSGITPAYFDLLQSAYSAAASGSVIQARVFEFVEDFLMDRAVAVILKGGYDTGYAVNAGMSTLRGTLTLGRGSLTVEKLMVK
jgi:hypothetical protein